MGGPMKSLRVKFNCSCILTSFIMLIFAVVVSVFTFRSIFDKFECAWKGDDTQIMTGSYNNFFRMFDRGASKWESTFEASRENVRPGQILKPRKVCVANKRKKDEISVDCLDFNKKILHSAWHPKDNVLAVAATNNLYLYHEKL